MRLGADVCHLHVYGRPPGIQVVSLVQHLINYYYYYYYYYCHEEGIKGFTFKVRWH